MADLLIRGMEMPKMPEKLEQGQMIPYVDVRIFASGDAVISSDERPYFKEYQAVEIPDHGRLIDADDFAAKYVASLPDALAALNDPKNIPRMTAIIQALLLDIAEADTIIPASKEGGA